MQQIKEINLVFHIGNGKTATTYLQRCMAECKSVYFIGKRTNDSNEDEFVNLEIDKIHYKLFPSYRGENTHSYSNPTRNSHDLVFNYARHIEAIIKKNSHIKSFVISDECIGDYYNYLGELNAFLVVAIGNILEKSLGADIKLHKVISITSRNQVDIIKSFIGYGWTLSRKNPADKIVKTMLTDSSFSYAGSLFYAKRYKLYSAIATGWKIQITPYEILSVDKNTERYITNVFMLDLVQARDIPSNILETKVNTNSEEINQVQKSIMRSKGEIKRLGFYLISQNSHALKLAWDRHDFLHILVHGVFHTIGSLLFKLPINLSRHRKQRYVKLSAECTRSIKSSYLQDNIDLQEILHQYDLHKYGYLE